MPTSKAFARYLQGHPDCRQIVLDPVGEWNDPFRLAAEVLHGETSFTCGALADRIVALRGNGTPPDRSWRDSWLASATRARRSLSAQIAGLDALF
jgi:2-succinyl-5-enolpyruvyl-6-hydroxy-3-cyclohexene-1-carboxylate synthase